MKSFSTILNNIDYGPLFYLIGTWQGGEGVDIAPEEEGEEKNQYYETLKFEPVRAVTNAEEQALVALNYRQAIIRKRDGKLIHHESGYYSWQASEQLLIKSFSIPRGVSVVAGGSYSNDSNGAEGDAHAHAIEVEALADSKDWSIVQSPFMQKKAKTLSYKMRLKVSEDKLEYAQTMIVDIFGRRFEHTDENKLVRSN